MPLAYLRHGMIGSARLGQREDDEASPSADLDHNRQELGVGGAEGAVMGVTGDLDVLVALGTLGGGPVNVTELGRAYAAKIHPGRATYVQIWWTEALLVQSV